MALACGGQNSNGGADSLGESQDGVEATEESMRSGEEFAASMLLGAQLR